MDTVAQTTESYSGQGFVTFFKIFSVAMELASITFILLFAADALYRRATPAPAPKPRRRIRTRLHAMRAKWAERRLNNSPAKDSNRAIPEEHAEEENEADMFRHPENLRILINAARNILRRVFPLYFKDDVVDGSNNETDSNDDEEVLTGFRTPELIRSHSLENNAAFHESPVEAEMDAEEEYEDEKGEEEEDEEKFKVGDNLELEEMQYSDNESRYDDEDEYKDDECTKNDETYEDENLRKLFEQQLREAFLDPVFRYDRRDDERHVPPPAPATPHQCPPLLECPNNRCRCTCSLQKQTISSTKLSIEEELKFDEFLLDEGLICRKQFGRNVLRALD